MIARLATLVEQFGGRAVARSGGVETPIVDVDFDSRRVREGCLFVAVPGAELDGRTFINGAIERGAAAVLAPDERHPSVIFAADEAGSVPFWLHPEPRRTAGLAAAVVHQDPSRALDVVAITGTNGKTTTAHLVAQLLEAAGRRPANIGTVEMRIAGAPAEPSRNTTPDAAELQRLLATHLRAGGDCCVLEASSHGLDQDRLAGLSIDVAVFTNLSRDHLDYHVDFDAYLAAKRRLFEALEPGGTAVLPCNADGSNEDVVQELARAARERGARVVTYGTGSRADLRVLSTKASEKGFELLLRGMGISWGSLDLPLLGRHNVDNALAALAAALCLKASPSALRTGLGSSTLPRGRFENVAPEGHPFRVAVDYAHTPDALRVALNGARETLQSDEDAAPGRVVCVFGCGGDRDAGKREEMGRTVAERADVLVVTNDNPRTEDPTEIAAAIERGVESAESEPELHVQLDRRTAIELALELAEPGDFVLIAGKGHETYQLIGTQRLQFDDAQVARELLS